MNDIFFPSIDLHAGSQAMILAVDDFLLPLRRNLCFYLTKPDVRPEPVLTPSSDNARAPDEVAAHFYGTVLHDDGEYRMWYYGLSLGDRPGPLREGPICYARSDDVYNWEKPNLGQLEFKGSKYNNAIGHPDLRTDGGRSVRKGNNLRRFRLCSFERRSSFSRAGKEPCLPFASRLTGNAGAPERLSDDTRAGTRHTQRRRRNENLSRSLAQRAGPRGILRRSGTRDNSPRSLGSRRSLSGRKQRIGLVAANRASRRWRRSNPERRSRRLHVRRDR